MFGPACVSAAAVVVVSVVDEYVFVAAAVAGVGVVFGADDDAVAGDKWVVQ